MMGLVPLSEEIQGLLGLYVPMSAQKGQMSTQWDGDCRKAKTRDLRIKAAMLAPGSWNFSASRIMTNKFLLLKSFSWWCFVNGSLNWLTQVGWRSIVLLPGWKVSLQVIWIFLLRFSTWVSPWEIPSIHLSKRRVVINKHLNDQMTKRFAGPETTVEFVLSANLYKGIFCSLPE